MRLLLFRSPCWSLVASLVRSWVSGSRTRWETARKVEFTDDGKFVINEGGRLVWTGNWKDLGTDAPSAGSNQRARLDFENNAACDAVLDKKRLDPVLSFEKCTDQYAHLDRGIFVNSKLVRSASVEFTCKLNDGRLVEYKKLGATGLLCSTTAALKDVCSGYDWLRGGPTLSWDSVSSGTGQGWYEIDAAALELRFWPCSPRQPGQFCTSSGYMRQGTCSKGKPT